jgi:hypothetical protein
LVIAFVGGNVDAIDAASYDRGLQSGFSFALQVGAVPGDSRERVATNLLFDMGAQKYSHLFAFIILIWTLTTSDCMI